MDTFATTDIALRFENSWMDDGMMMIDGYDDTIQYPFAT